MSLNIFVLVSFIEKFILIIYSITVGEYKMNFNKMIKKLDVLDIGLVKWATLAIAFLIAKYLPAVTSLAWYWYVVAFAVLTVRPLMHMFKK